MPGKTGVKLIPRKSVSGKYHSVKELVFGLLEKSNGTCTKEAVEKVVRKEYPKSNFLSKDGKGGHFTWYKHRWNKMKLEEHFTLKEGKNVEEEKSNEPVGNESKKSKAKRTESVESATMGKRPNRRKGGRVPVQPKKRNMDVKARKVAVQRKGNTGISRRDKVVEEVHN